MDDQLKQCIMAAILTFNIVVISYMLIGYFAFNQALMGKFVKHLLISFVIGGVCSAGAFIGVKMSQR